LWALIKKVDKTFILYKGEKMNLAEFIMDLTTLYMEYGNIRVTMPQVGGTDEDPHFWLANIDDIIVKEENREKTVQIF
jgi:hypothetical protein